MSPEPGGPVDWDASTYHRVADNQEEWGTEVLERLDLSGDETVLDAGCGSGRVTRLLLERLPRGRVIGVDAAPSMIEEARSNLSEYGDRVELRVGNLVDLEMEAEVDAVFSNATFHWIDEPMTGCSPSCMRPFGPAARSRRSAGERGTSPSGSGRWSRRWATSASRRTSAA